MPTRFASMLRHTLLAAAAVVLVGAPACGDQRISKKNAESYVDEWSADAGSALREAAQVDPATDRFASRLKEAASKAEQNVDRETPPYDLLVRDVYRELDWEMRFTDGNGWTSRGKAVWKIVSAIDTHGVNPKSFDFEAIRTALENLEQARTRIDELASWEPSQSERKAAVEWLTRQKIADFELAEDSYGRLLRAVADESSKSDLTTKLEEMREQRDRAEQARAQLEHLLARNTVRYSRKMKHFRRRHLFIHDREDDYWNNPVIRRNKEHAERPDEAEASLIGGMVWRKAANVAHEVEKPVEILRTRMRRTLKRTLEEEDAAGVLEELAPDHPQYAKLRDEYRRYRQIVADGGWPEVPVDRGLRPGVRDENVKTLKKRLRTEGFYPEDADVDDHYDQTLADAVEAYQETHQMQVTGQPHDMFWSSINRSAKHRMDQLALNLRRWRESNVRHSDGTYVLVNIPGFHVEFWKQKERNMRFPIVVGKTDKRRNEEDETLPAGMAIRPEYKKRRRRRRQQKKDDEKKEDENKDDDEFLYDTPELSAYIDRVIYNPYWNITDSIRRVEILPKVRRSVENKYIEKLRSLRAKKQELRRKIARRKQPRRRRTERGEEGPRRRGTSDDRTLVATRSGTGGSRDDSNAEPASSSSERPSESESGAHGESASGSGNEGAPSTFDSAGSPNDSNGNDGEASGDADSSNGGGSESSSDDGDTNNQAKNKAKDQSKNEEEKPTVEDLYETKELENTEKLVKKYRVFDVPGIRKLLNSVEKLEEKSRKLDAKNADSPFAAVTQSERAESKKKTTDGSGNSDDASEDEKSEKSEKSPMERRFPYLDLKSGLVDVSTTDPDHVPAWYEENDYQVMFPGEEWEYVRQKQGDENALGRVKVIFPNKHGVYLHDTPKKNLFNRKLRAFSHGCMRMEKPLDFAEQILRTDGKFDDVNVAQLLRGEKKEVERKNGEGTKMERQYTYKPIFLDSPIPVHVDYFTVRVDDQGRANFFADIYDKDEKRLNGKE